MFWSEEQMKLNAQLDLVQIIIHHHQLVSSFIIKHFAFSTWLFDFAETYVQLDLVQLAKNNEVKTFSNWGKEFSVTFDFIAKKAQPTTPGSRTTSILHISGMAIQVIEFSSGGIQNWKDDSKFNHVLLVC